MKQRSDGVAIIAIYQFIVGFLSLLGICGLLSIPLIVGASTAAARVEGGAIATAIVSTVMIFVAGILLLAAVANVIIGWGLWKQREWGRIGALVLAVLGLLKFPVGTIIGALIIWYLLRENVRQEFQAQPQAQPPVLSQLPEPSQSEPPKPLEG
jgi:hypothetical protein